MVPFETDVTHGGAVNKTYLFKYVCLLYIKISNFHDVCPVK